MLIGGVSNPGHCAPYILSLIEWCMQEQGMMKYKEVMAIFRKQCKFINNFFKIYR